MIYFRTNWVHLQNYGTSLVHLETLRLGQCHLHCKTRFVKMGKLFCHLKFMTGAYIFLLSLQNLLVNFTNCLLINTNNFESKQKFVQMTKYHLRFITGPKMFC